MESICLDARGNLLAFCLFVGKNFDVIFQIGDKAPRIAGTTAAVGRGGLRLSYDLRQDWQDLLATVPMQKPCRPEASFRPQLRRRSDLPSQRGAQRRSYSHTA